MNDQNYFSSEKLSTSEIPSTEKNIGKEKDFVVDNIKQIFESSTREKALAELSKMRESFNELAIYLWYTPGIIATLYICNLVFRK